MPAGISKAPFPGHDPRITTASFLGEVMGLPGFIFCRHVADGNSLLSILFHQW
jgi:hypothetical protein